jgi:UDP-N-acetylmuramate dehydrogenase
MSGIPGTVGGGVRTNAGAMGHELSEVLARLEVLTPGLKVQKLSRSDVQFEYRHSSLGPDSVVLTGTLRLSPGEPKQIAARIAEVREKRRATQPRGASAGSVFRNPRGDSAGRLIDQAGLKGRHVGDAVVSGQHANFIINRGKARFLDVRQLVELIKLKVEEKFGVILEEEIETVAGLEGA